MARAQQAAGPDGRRARLVAALLLAVGAMLLAGGCGTSHDVVIGGAAGAGAATTVGSGAKVPSPTPTARTTAAPGTAGKSGGATGPVAPVDAAGLAALLLTAGDVHGYSVSLAVPPYGQSALSACPALAAVPAGSRAGQGIALADPATGAALDEYDFALPTADAADTALAAFAALPRQCRSFHGEVSGYAAEFTAAPLALAPVGGPSAAARFTGVLSLSGVTGTVYEDVVALRSGPILVVLTSFGISPDTASTQSAAEAAYQKAAAGSASSAPTGSAAPVVPQTALLTGSWRDGAGDVIRFTPAGPNAWTGELVRQGGALCGPLDIRVAGVGGRRFTGTVTDYAGLAGTCGPATGRGQITIVAEPNGASLAATRTAAAGKPCPTCAPAAWDRADDATGTASSAPPAPPATRQATASSGTDTTARLAGAILLALVAVLAIAVARELRPRRRSRPSALGGPGPDALDGVAGLEAELEAALPPAERAARLALRLRRALLTDPRVLPAATSLRFATLVLMLIASTGSIYAYIGLDSLRIVDPETVLCTSQAGPPGVGQLVQLTGSATVELGCTQRYATDIVSWSLGGIALTILLTALVYALTPWWITRINRSWLPWSVRLAAPRRRLRLRMDLHRPWWLSPSRRLRAFNPSLKLEADILARVRFLADATGVPTPRCVLDPSMDTDARAFGSRRRGQVKINSGLLRTFRSEPRHFDAVLLHELGHLRNRDVAYTYITYAAWRVFVGVTLVPYLLQILFPYAATRGSLRLAPQWPSAHILAAVSVLSVLLYLSRNAVLRIRETHADAAAAVHVPDGMREAIARKQAADGRPRRLRIGVLSHHPSLQQRLDSLADPSVLAAPDRLALFGTGVGVSLFAVNLQFVLWVVAVASWASGSGLLDRIVHGTIGSPGILSLELGVWGPAMLLEFGVLAALACAVMWRSQLNAVLGGRRASAVLAAMPLALGIMVGQPMSFIYADANTWGVFDVNGAWELADAAASTLALAVLATLVFRWAGESAAVWIPVARRSLRRWCAAAALSALAAIAPAALTWSILENSGSMTSLIQIRQGGRAAGWIGSSWAYTVYVPLNYISGRLPAGVLLLVPALALLAVGSWRRSRVERPHWLAPALAPAAPLLQAARQRSPTALAITAGLSAASASAGLGLLVVLTMQARYGAAQAAADLGLGGSAVLTAWLTWITVIVTAVAAAVAAYQARDLALSTALLTAFVAGTFSSVLLLVPMNLGLCGRSLTCAVHPARVSDAAVLGPLSASVPIEAALVAVLAAGAAWLAGRRGGTGLAAPATWGEPPQRASRIYISVTLVISVLLAVTGLWVYLPMWRVN